MLLINASDIYYYYYICGRCNVFIKRSIPLNFLAIVFSRSLLLLTGLILLTQVFSGCNVSVDSTPPADSVDTSVPSDTTPGDTTGGSTSGGSTTGGSTSGGTTSGGEPPPVVNVAPVADPGTYQVVSPKDKVILDGTGSHDANGDTLSYIWTFISKPSGSQAVMSNRYMDKPSFTADMEGKYIIQLVVNDGEFDSMASNITVMAAAFSVTVSWSPNPDNPAGYAVYAGSTTSTATQLVQTLVRGSSGWDPAAPSIGIDSTTLLEAVGAGTQACFVIKAFNGVGTSDVSDSTCVNLP